MRYKLAVLFTQPPFGSATSREGLDAVLAASAFCDEDEIAICFLFDGVFNLLKKQQPEQILQKDHIATFKLLELYELSECFICQQSVTERGLDNAEWILQDVQFVAREQIFACLRNAEKVLTF
ncbi:sulfurtransferase complex subunit TusC [Bibersteinia trehalosi]|uniref:sulfurtransferase complex subunit TusC n=1 Tax=Bibersteinia trehalosi TaxID=47735 RepID=UPI00046D1D5A|nr:sulfurtransferase complex subunit TusC [Bibersteinia trehalosi]